MFSIICYIKEFTRAEWLKKFFFAKTPPLKTPPHFRDFPVVTDKECTHELRCMMICPAPGAIEVLKDDEGKWGPVIYKGHCIRCGLCVEACPDDVLTSGRILEQNEIDRTSYLASFHITVNDALCMKCGNCSVACPVNKEIDPELAYNATSSSGDVIMRVKNSKLTILHPEKCTGCKTCEETCPNRAIRVARIVEGDQDTE
ncbi:formate hydrogenlyase subunit 6/NADH:ubiquinone oxidoreductase subunit I [Methanomicrobium sp. W14]|uniref:4Fe-4S binding protein n=1 Tax=Methanomicrobium sp. W14 TaxID=2817839 RepID=UPI001AE16EDB|nr:4Fe-4S binding protein [Methanomicrobium sp. W14]MBP2132335.1 formate hydrogenlyase subunit 6/NADH:ubiquinone oxidoreductase subunit I [Methanomicrobium sp. W14]